MLTDTRDRIRAVHAVGHASDPLAVRRRIERAIEPASLHPRALAPRAIVCVRRLRTNESAIDRPDWRARLEERMQTVVAHAARPFDGPVPADAGAVVFHDEAELLACLLRDAGRAGSDAWWWRGLFGDARPMAIAERVLPDSAQFVPAAVALLDARGLAAEAVAMLPHAACVVTTRRVREVFGLTTGVDRTAATRHPDPRADTNASNRARDLLDVAVTRDSVAVAGLTRAARELLILSLALARASDVARSAQFIARLDDWMLCDRASNRSQLGAMDLRSPVDAGSRLHEHRDDGRSRVRDDVQPPAPSLYVTDARDDAVPSASTETPLEMSQAATPWLGEVAGPTDDVRTPLAATAPGRASALEVSSACGGLFYLVNVALHLELYADFANPSREELPVPFADFLTAIGRRVCGSRFRGDPAWDILAHLAGRSSTKRVRLDSRWLAPIADRMATRVGIALGIPPRATLRFLARRAARIALSATRLDVHFALATHPLSIRIAGLDRNPGWVPAFGRIIEFHYE